MKKVRNKKRKVAEEDHDRIPVTRFDSDVGDMAPPVAGPSSKPTIAQRTLSETWTSSTGDPTKLTTQRQAKLDYFLLRFLVCCSIAWAVLDNGFFWDFVVCL